MNNPIRRRLWAFALALSLMPLAALSEDLTEFMVDNAATEAAAPAAVEWTLPEDPSASFDFSHLPERAVNPLIQSELDEKLAGENPPTMARDITADVLLNGGTKLEKLRDGNYGTDYSPKMQNGARAITIEAPEGETLGHLEIRWMDPVGITVEEYDEAAGEWKFYRNFENSFYVQYIPLNGQQKVRFYALNNPKEKITVAEVRVLTPGELPADVQVWESPSSKADLMLVSTHPDDEVLWFGGLLPYYSIIRKKNVVLVNMIPCVRKRRIELCDCLWSMGLTAYPIFGRWPDVNTSNLEDVYKQINKIAVSSFLTAQVRKYRPDVLVLHDVNGEYGHAMHKMSSQAGRLAYEHAADPSMYPEQVEKYGTWQVKKCYIHLYAENQMHMNWFEPQEVFGGKSCQQMAREGMQYHKSQLINHRPWKVEDGGIHDNSLFGLYATEVGEDVAKNDLLEHLEDSGEPSPKISEDPFECLEK